MKNLLITISIALIPSLSFAESLTIHVDGMFCAFCAQGIEKKFKAIEGVKAVKVSLEDKTVSLSLKDGVEIPKAKMEEIIKSAGFKMVNIASAGDDSRM